MTNHEDNIDTISQSFRKTENTGHREKDSCPFYCGAEWHLRELSPICSLLYPLAYRLTKGNESRTFYSTAKTLADFFDRSASQVRKGLRELTKLGFFELVSKKKFHSNVYRVLGHKNWAEKHPGMCAMKESFPYTGEGDPLGQELMSASGGLLKFKPHQICNIRNLGLSEEYILNVFVDYWKQQSEAGDYKKTPTDFYIKLKKGVGHGEQDRAA